MVKHGRSKPRLHNDLHDCKSRTKAVAPHLTTSSFINALRCFIARGGGFVNYWYSDHGSDFIRVEKFVRDDIKQGIWPQFFIINMHLETHFFHLYENNKITLFLPNLKVINILTYRSKIFKPKIAHHVVGVLKLFRKARNCWNCNNLLILKL